MAAGGVLVLRSEDLDAKRFRLDFADAMLEDLRWFGFRWQEGPDCGGPHGPYAQSQRGDFYRAALEKLRRGGWIYPCRCSRGDVLRALQAPHAGEEEPVYPGTCRPAPGTIFDGGETSRVNWRFRVPDGEVITFVDGSCGLQRFQAGEEFGDFVVWRHDDVPAYQLSVVVDDAAMRITEVVRGEDLLVSTARQLLLYRALELAPPTFYHCALMKDESGVRLAKRHDALSLRRLRAQGYSPGALRDSWKPALKGAS